MTPRAIMLVEDKDDIRACAARFILDTFPEVHLEIACTAKTEEKYSQAAHLWSEINDILCEARIELERKLELLKNL